MKPLLYIDLFCGAGGTSTGVESATVDGHKCAKVIACVNHDPNAIASHLSNHPKSLHFTEDIRTLDLTELVNLTESKRKENPNALLVLWASLECTNFSRAKGGMPRDADSRTLAEHLFRYIDALNPDYIQIENVREFMMWGDLDENGKPISKDAGRLYLRWIRNVCGRGYVFDHRILNAADYGAYTSRQRFFGIFAKKGLPIVFPKPTHGKVAEQTLFDKVAPWRPVREVLDLDDCGKSIFRDKPLSEKTLERIYAGLVKFIGNDRKSNKRVSFLSKQFSGDPDSKNIGIDGPAGAITTIDHHAFITAYYGKGSNSSIDTAAPAVLTKDHLAIVEARFLMNPQFGSDGASIDKPCFTLIARMDKKPPYLVTAKAGTITTVQAAVSPMTIKIKRFMAEYGISDICMRMLKITELKRIMGFPEDYVLVGTQQEQKKYIGNAVEVHQAAALACCLSAAL